ncbi:hypothetical protein AVEN_112939-1, partial [Araneus ventricosus]
TDVAFVYVNKDVVYRRGVGHLHPKLVDRTSGDPGKCFFRLNFPIESKCRIPLILGLARVVYSSAETPAFWNDKPELWLAQLESRFALGNISVDSTGFVRVLTSP